MRFIMKTPSPWTLHVNDFRTLDQIRWSPPSGVSILAGPNGAGKTTILSALRFLATAFKHNIPDAIRLSGGGAAIRRLGVLDRTPVRFKLEVGDVAWQVELPIEGEGVHAYHGETIVHGSEVVARATMYQNAWDMGNEAKNRDARCCLRVLWDQDRPKHLEPLVFFLESLRAYPSWWPDAVRELQRGSESEAFLNNQGTNIWRVLREWKQAPRRFDDRFQWVLEAAARAFPELVSEIDFSSLGRAVQGNFYHCGVSDSSQSLPMYLAADGLLQGLLHLTAVAGAEPGSVVAIDELENHLHPHAIRSILSSLREWAQKKGLTVLVTTHSPLVMNEFQQDLERFFTSEVHDGVRPARLGALKNPDWLAQFALGDLYDRLKFAAPALPQPIDLHSADEPVDEE